MKKLLFVLFLLVSVNLFAQDSSAVQQDSSRVKIEPVVVNQFATQADTVTQIWITSIIVNPDNSKTIIYQALNDSDRGLFVKHYDLSATDADNKDYSQLVLLLLDKLGLTKQ